MRISDIKSIELNRERAFEHEIIFRDANGYPIDRFYVKENVEWEQFELVTKAWFNHPEYSGEGKER